MSASVMAELSPPPGGASGRGTRPESSDSTASPPESRPGGSSRSEAVAWPNAAPRGAQLNAPFHRQAFAAIDLGTNN